MGFERNIAKKIQAGLNARLRAMSTHGNSALVSSQVLNPLSQVEGDSKTVANDFKLSRAAEHSKAPWVRMTGAGDGTIDVITGTFNQSLDTQLKLNSVSGVQNLTGGPEALYNLERGEDITLNRFGNKAPGITDISVTHLDSGFGGGTSKKATITWQCWSISDLEKFQRNSFLSLGAGIIVDFGWARSDKDISNELAPPDIIKLSDDGKVEINEDLFIREKNPDGTNKPYAWQLMAEEKYGDWEGLVGTVSNFTWAMNEQGGFDCTTDVAFLGVNGFTDENTNDSAVDGAPPLSDSKTGLEDTNAFDQFVLSTYKMAMNDKMTDKDGVLGDAKIGALTQANFSKINTSKQINILQRISMLDVEIYQKFFSAMDKKKWVGEEGIIWDDDVVDPGPQVLIDSTEGNAQYSAAVAMIIYPYKVEHKTEEDGEEIVTTTYEAQSLVESKKKVGTEIRNSKFKSDLWIQWGWFEDNVVSYYSSTSGDEKISFRSVEAWLDEEETELASDTEDDTPESNIVEADVKDTTGSYPLIGDPPREFHPGEGQNILLVDMTKEELEQPVDNPPPASKPKPSNKTFAVSTQIRNHEMLVTHSPDFILPGQTPNEWFPKTVGKENQANHYKALAKLIDSNAAPFAANGKKTSGYLRHIFVNYKLIKSAFSNPGTPIDQSMLKLAKLLNRRIKLWDFEVKQIEGTHAENIAVEQYYGIFAKESSGQEIVKDTEKPSRSYIFENYGMNSLITDMTMNTNFDSDMATVMAITRSDKKNIDPIQKLMGKKQTFKQSEATDMARFFASTDAGNANWDKFVKNYIAKTLGNHAQTIEDEELYGNPFPTMKLANKDTWAAGFVRQKGLSKTAWNHNLSNPILKLIPNSPYRSLERMESMFKRVAESGAAKIDLNDLKDGVDYDKVVEEMNMYAIPPLDKGNLVFLNEQKVKDIQKEGASVRSAEQREIPYAGATFDLNPKYMKTLKWYLSDNPLTAVLTAKDPDKSRRLPLDISFSIDGCGGLRLGNMFRLAYLPQHIYKQVGNKTDEGDYIPGSYFIITQLEQKITATGWKTSITGVLRSNFNVILKDQIENNEEIDEAQLREAVEKAFKQNFTAMTDEQIKKLT